MHSMNMYAPILSAIFDANPWQLNTQPSDSADIEEEVANISAATTLIHLTQAIYFQPNPSAIMAEDLMHWVNRLESRPDRLEGEDIMRRHPACHHPSYWGFLHKYVPFAYSGSLAFVRAASRALFKVAIGCLRTAGLVEYENVDPNIIDHFVHLLNSAPLGKQSQLARKPNELYELANAWKHWQSDLELPYHSFRADNQENPSRGD